MSTAADDGIHPRGCGVPPNWELDHRQKVYTVQKVYTGQKNCVVNYVGVPPTRDWIGGA